MNSNTYSINGENLSLGTGSGLVAIQTNSGVLKGATIAIRRIEVGQSATATGAQVRLVLSTRDTAGTYTVTSQTPRNIAPLGGPISGIVGNVAPAGAVARCGINSSADSGGTYVDHYAAAFSNLNGWLWVPMPGEEIIVPPSTLWVVRFAAAPGTTTGWSCTVVYEELT